MTALLVLSTAALTSSLTGGCSSGGRATDGGTDSGAEGGPTFTQTGQIVDYSSNAGLGDMIVSGGGASTTTDSKGNYTLSVPRNQPYTMTTSSGPNAASSYLTLDEQEWMLTGDANRGKTAAVSNGTETLLKAILSPAPDTTLAILTIQVIALGGDAGSCSSATGTTISVPGMAIDGGTGAHLLYFDGGTPNLPSASATSVTNGALPSAIIYDLPVSASFNQVTVTPPGGCTVKAFPITDPGVPTISYTGNVKLEASQNDAGANVASFMRVFLQ